MKKILIFLLALATFLPAQTFTGVDNFPSMTIFSLEMKDGHAYYIRLDNSKKSAVHKLGNFKLYGENGKKVIQNIQSAVFDDSGYLWFVNKGWSKKTGAALYKIDGSKFQGEGGKIEPEFVGYLGSKLKFGDYVTGLVFNKGKLYGLTALNHQIISIDTTNGLAEVVATIKTPFFSVSMGLSKVDTVFYLFLGSRNHWGMCSRNYYDLFKFNSFPAGEISKVMTINLKGHALRAAVGHPNGFIYAAYEEGIFKVNVANLKFDCVLHFSSGIGGMAFYLPNQTPQTIDQNYADLSLSGEVDKANPKNGDNVHFTFTLKNSGPDKATNIVVKNTLQKGLDIVSENAGAGTASDSLNVITWEVPSLDVGQEVTLKVTANLNIKDANKSVFDLGPAKGYNVFVIHNADSLISDTDGKMFVGNYAHLGTSYSVGYALRNDSSNQNVLVVGHTLEYGPRGAIYGGNVVFGKDTIFHDFNPELDIVNGKLIKDWKYARSLKKKSYLIRQLAARLYKYTPNGKTTLDFSTLRLNGSSPFLNVFSVNKSQIESATDFIINVPNGSVVLVNFKDKYSRKDTLHWGGGLKVFGADYSNVIYNFYKTRYLQIKGINVTGTILAPKTNVNFVDGQQNGQMIALNLQGHAQYNNILFVGNLPYDSTLYSVAEVVSVDQVDTNSTPDNGVTTEDDFVSLGVRYNSRGASGNSGKMTFNWKLVGKFKSDELVWTMEPEPEGTFLVGTWGGNIYRTDSATTWTLLNENQMDSVTYIWSIKEMPDGKIFVGTERGVYLSENNGQTWKRTSFSKGDVRCLAYFNNNIYAGTWGSGLYKSTDSGKNWSKINNNISKAAVVGLTVNDEGELFIGTFDVGLYKSNDGGKTVTKLNIEYPYIWTLGKSDDGVIYAGTYGNGLYSSADAGVTWGREFPVEANYIYAVRTKGKRIYATSWESGVFTGVIKSISKKSNLEKVAGGSTVDWYEMGLSGYGVSSVLPSNDGNYVYAGTNSGEVYRADASITSVKSQKPVPAQFKLSQNYPNPFGQKTKGGLNTTQIEYQISKPCFVTLKIYDILGRELKTLVRSNENAGIYKVTFNADNLPSGIYFYQLKAGGFTEVRKMVLLR